MKYETTSKRLISALNSAGITQRELSERAGIGEASVSQYINGSHAPSNVSSMKMGKVLGVNPLWLMGFDVDVNGETPKSELGTLINGMSDEQQKRLLSYARFIMEKE